MLRIFQPVGEGAGIERRPAVCDIQVRVFKGEEDHKDRQQAEHLHDQVLRQQDPDNIAGNQDDMVSDGVDQHTPPEAVPAQEQQSCPQQQIKE